MASLINSRDVDIDPNNLDQEWIQQPTMFARYSSLLADARQDYDESRSQLELVRAELDQAIRSNPENYGLAKVTEKTVESAIPIQSEYKEAQQAVIDSRHHMDVVSGVVSALDHRKAALGKLVDLFLAGYFSKPKAAEANDEQVEQMKRKTVRRKGRRDQSNDDD